MKRIFGGIALLGLSAALAACSAKEERDYSESAERAAPDISPTAAPNVAFQYAYQFLLPDESISSAQEAQAAACEKLGIDRCRITGMSYRVDEREQVEGSLNISIDAALARGFGKDAAAVVEKEGGKLRSAEITGEDQTADLEAAAARERAANEVAGEAGNAMSETNNVVERDINRQQALAARLAAAEARDQSNRTQDKIKRTPMSFTYYGDAGGRGFGGENPLREAWYLLVDSAATLVSFVLKAIAVILPWSILLLLAFLLYRSRVGRAVRGWIRKQDESVGID